MIEKIIEISNIGHFTNFKLHGTNDWNGQLRKLNIIYAPNSSGKTTLSTILKSLAQNNLNLVQFKKTFGSASQPKVIIKEYGNNNLINLDSTTWSPNTLNIEVFDINYIEEYLFSGSFIRKQNKANLFELLLGDKGKKLRMDMKPIYHKIHRLTKSKFANPNLSIEEQLELKGYNDEISVLIQEYENYSKSIYDKHIEIVNKYLSKFTSYITLAEFSHSDSSEFEKFRIFPIFTVYEERIAFTAPNKKNNTGDARYSMSEGDKSTIALCFFLARLEIKGVTDKIIVFDDPLSSFDYARRNSTIFQLAKIAESCVQFILLTHDMGFANDFTDKCSYLDSVNLKIVNNENGSHLTYHDIQAEFLTATQKDLEVIKKHLIKPATSESDKREVVRCIRPVLEGIFKIKYFDIINNNVWLGEIIEMIRVSDSSSRLHFLKKNLDDVIELNDFTKKFHHGTSGNKDESINPIELKRYITLLMNVIENI